MGFYKVNFFLLLVFVIAQIISAQNIQRVIRPLGLDPNPSAAGRLAPETEGVNADGGVKRTVKRGALYGGYGGLYGAGYGYGGYGLYGGLYGGWPSYGYGLYDYPYYGYGYGFGSYPYGYGHGYYW